MSEHRYTAQEMRDTAQCLHYNSPTKLTIEAAAMLRQSADTEDELSQLKASKDRWMQYQETAAGERNACIDELRKRDAENAQLKARLDAVVKLATEEIWRDDKDQGVSVNTCAKIHNSVLNDILRAARGEGGAE